MHGKGTYKKLRQAVGAVEDAANPLEALAAARRLREAAEALELALVAEARDQRGTWTEIGAVYGTSKQGAQQRFRSIVRSAGDSA
ncbi:MAG: hypothetical protein ACT4O0_13500 [Pseudonocardia sp.]|jgi:hypothetical protein